MRALWYGNRKVFVSVHSCEQHGNAAIMRFLSSRTSIRPSRKLFVPAAVQPIRFEHCAALRWATQATAVLSLRVDNPHVAWLRKQQMAVSRRVFSAQALTLAEVVLLTALVIKSLGSKRRRDVFNISANKQTSKKLIGKLMNRPVEN